MILSWAISFSIFALIAAALGFSHAAAATSVVARICFGLFAFLSLVRAISGGDRRTRAAPDLAQVPRVRVSEARPAKGVALAC